VTLFVGQASSLKRQRASQVAGLSAVTIGVAVVIGQWAGLPMLSSWGSGLPAMRSLGALWLTAFGLALVRPGKDSRLAFAVGLAGIVGATLGLVLLLFKIELGIDRWLGLRALGSLRVTSAGMLAFGLVAGALALSRFEGHRFAATVLAGIVGGITALALLGYLSGVDTLYGSTSVNSPSLPAAFGLLCVAVGIISRIGTMPTLRRPRPLRHLLVMLGLAIVAPLLLFVAYAAFRIADAQLDDVREDLTMEARTLSAGVDQEIVGEIERLQALAASPSLRQGDFAEFQRQAEASLALRQSGNIVLIDRNMQQLLNTAVPFGEPLPKSPIPKFLERAFTTGKPQVTGLFMSSATHQLLFAIIVPVQIDYDRRYVLGRSPDHRALARVVAANKLPTGWQAVVSDTTHHIIARSEPSDAFVGQELSPSQWHGVGPDSVFEFVDTEGRLSQEAYARSELTGWETAVWAPKALLEAPVRAQWRTLGVTALLAIALVVALALWLGRIIARSVGQAAHAAIGLGEGGPPSRTPVVEVNALMAKLRRAAARRQSAEQDLQASKYRLQLALDATQLGSFQYDRGRRVLSWDGRCKKVFGVAEDELHVEDLVKLMHPDDKEMVWTFINTPLYAPEKSEALVHRILRGGEVRWIEVHRLAYFEDAGRGRHAEHDVGTIQDITGRKEREEKEQLLMREINHRAKNMLSVVEAIAHQTAARTPERFIERFSERIQALSANQDLLVRNEWRGVDAEDLVRAQLAPFAELIGSRISLHDSKMRLNAASAQSIGLALHELVTNAGKYGALSTDKGRVDIGWRIDGGTFTMSWTEREGPPVLTPERRGFGTIVMGQMTERSVNCRVDLEYPPSGVTWRLTCPAANVLSAGNDED
jgi:PAS domain S-box-containing protein